MTNWDKVLLRSKIPLDKSRGCAFISQSGDLFYSPNGLRVVQVPPPPVNFNQNPFLPPNQPANSDMRRYNYWDLDVSSFKTPHWWTDWYGWVSFLQMDDNEFNTSLFRSLKTPLTQYIPESDTSEEPLKEGFGYMLAPCERDNWHRLDRQIYYACNELGRVFKISGFIPTHPWVMGYLRPHKQRGAFTMCLDKTRKWFKVFLAFLSYLIAASMTCEEIKLDEFPVRIPLPGYEYEGKGFHWRDVLLSGGQEVGVDQWWIDFLSETSVTCYEKEVERVGVFLCLESSSPFCTWEPDPTFFCAYNVPVWYPWTNKQSKNKYFAHLAPLPHQIQTATTFLCKSLSPKIPDAQDFIEDSGYSPSPHSKPVVSTEKMDEFFQLRWERNRRLEAAESKLDLERRLNRERQKPTTSASMFLWTLNDHGEYESKPVPRRERETYFVIYDQNKQMRYDSFHNEWHVCELWGPDIINEDFEAFYDGDLREEGDLPGPPDVDHEAVLDGDNWQNTKGDTTRTRTSARTNQFEGEILEVLSLYFGYTPEIPLPKREPVQDKKCRMKICRWLGIEWYMIQSEETQRAFQRSSVAAAIDFFQRIAQGPKGKISTDEWDLFSENRYSVVHTPRFSQFRQVTSTDGVKLFMLDLREKKEAVWYLALKHAADMAVVCRLDQGLTEFDIVEFLLQNGIPFHTLIPSNLVSRAPVTSRPSLLPPFRPKDYQFGPTDYFSYRERCKSILQHPRGRAALMHGGLMWRLAVTVVVWETVYRGPSGWSPEPEKMIVVSDSTTNLELLDDRLSLIEQEALCGTYHCHSGQRNSDQLSTSSWYMPPELFSRSAPDMGRWTGYSEKVFRLIDSSSDQSPELKYRPRTRKEWKKQAKGSGNCRALIRADQQVLRLLSSF